MVIFPIIMPSDAHLPDLVALVFESSGLFCHGFSNTSFQLSVVLIGGFIVGGGGFGARVFVWSLVLNVRFCEIDLYASDVMSAFDDALLLCDIYCPGVEVDARIGSLNGLAAAACLFTRVGEFAGSAILFEWLLSARSSLPGIVVAEGGDFCSVGWGAIARFCSVV